MANKRLSMRKIKEVLRLRFELRLGLRQIGRSLHLPHSTVGDYLDRAALAGIGWPLPEGLSDTALEGKLFPPAVSIAGVGPSQPTVIQSKYMKFPAKNSLRVLFLASKSPL